MPERPTLYRRIRSRLRDIEPLRRAYHFLIAFKLAFWDSSERSRAELDDFYALREDRWDYARDLEQRRMDAEVALVDQVAQGRRFSSVLELGCAEGMYTERLATRSERLVSVDISAIAVDRARRRLAASPHVGFECWDVRDWPTDRSGAYDLVSALHVLEYVRSPFAMRRVRANIVDSLRDGGYLLIGSVYQDTYVERTRWLGAILVQGGNWINSYFASHPQLTVVAQSESDLGVCWSRDVLLRKSVAR